MCFRAGFENPFWYRGSEIAIKSSELKDAVVIVSTMYPEAAPTAPSWPVPPLPIGLQRTFGNPLKHSQHNEYALPVPEFIGLRQHSYLAKKLKLFRVKALTSLNQLPHRSVVSLERLELRSFNRGRTGLIGSWGFKIFWRAARSSLETDTARSSSRSSRMKHSSGPHEHKCAARASSPPR
jgi:hypothetical protein